MIMKLDISLALAFFDKMTGLVFAMWESISNFDIVSFEHLGLTYEVSYGSLIVAFGLLYILVFAFFRSR